jgi:hypothetical protein
MRCTSTITGPSIGPGMRQSDVAHIPSDKHEGPTRMIYVRYSGDGSMIEAEKPMHRASNMPRQGDLNWAR